MSAHILGFRKAQELTVIDPASVAATSCAAEPRLAIFCLCLSLMFWQIACQSVTMQDVDHPSYDRLEQATIDIIEGIKQNLDDPAKQDPYQLGFHYSELGRWYYSLEFDQAALTCFRNKRQLADDYGSAYYEGRIAHTLGDLPACIKAMIDCLEMYPSYLPASVFLSQAYRESGELMKAQSVLDEVDDQGAAILYERALIAQRQGDPNKVIQFARRALEQEPEANALNYPLGIALRDTGETELAEKYLSARGNRNPQLEDPLMDDIANLQAGNRALAQDALTDVLRGDHSAALEKYRKCIAEEPENARLHRNMAVALKMSGDLESALSSLTISLELEPSHPKTLFNLGTVLSLLGRDEEATVYYQNALQAAPEFTDAAFNLANLLRRQHNYEDSVHWFDHVLKARPGNRDAHMGYIVGLIGLEDWESAENAVQTAILGVPTDPIFKNLSIRLQVAVPDRFQTPTQEVFDEASLLYRSETNLINAETYAMILAAIHRWPEAEALQLDIIKAADTAKKHEILPRLQKNLAAYQAHKHAQIAW